MKKKQQTSKDGEGIGVFLFVIFLIIVVGIIGSDNTPSDFELAEPCLNDIATNYCKTKDLVFDRTYHNNDNFITFYCKEDERVLDSTRFKFTEADIDKCYNQINCEDHTHHNNTPHTHTPTKPHTHHCGVHE